MRILSYGGGVQTRALLHLILHGHYDKPDLILFADTQGEPQDVYAAVWEDAEAAHKAGIPFHTCTNGDLTATDQWGGVFIPAFTTNPDGSAGMLRRQCTQRFKIAPIRRHLRSLGVKQAELWLGISTDEIERMKPSNVKWLTHAWPLIEMELNRSDCLSILNQHKLAPVKSACTFCPYHSASEWKRIKGNPDDWQSAIEYDRAIRNKRDSQGRELFVHPSRLPLDEAPIEDPSLQDDLWGNECGGHCGV